MANKFKRGDEVKIISGSNKGKIGKILHIIASKVLVEGVNLATKHKKPISSSPGKIITTENPIHISNISHFDGNNLIKTRFVIRNRDKKPFFTKDRILKKTDKKIL